VKRLQHFAYTARFVIHVSGTQPQFQWEYRSHNHTQWTLLPNAQDSVLLLVNVPSTYDQRRYRVRVWNDCGDTVISQPALLTVYQSPTIALSSVTGTPPPSLIWEYSTDDGGSWQAAATNTATLELLLQSQWHNRLYRLRAVNTCGADTSLPFRLLVYTPPSIIHDPIDQSVCPGDPVTFSITADGFPSPALRWEYSTDTGKTWISIPDSDTLQLSIDGVPADWNGMLIRTIAYNQCGADTSAAARLHVYTPPHLLSLPSDTTVCTGDTVIFAPIVVADPLPSYQWQLQLPEDDQWITLPGATSDTLRLPAISFDQNGERYRLLILHPCDTVITVPVTLTVVAPPQILQQPISVETRVAKSATFTVVADTFARAYQWYRDKMPLQDGARIHGSTTPTLTITAVHPTDVSNNYYCVVSGDCGSDTSRSVSLTVIVPGISITKKTAYSKNAALIVNVPPVITQAPPSASLCAGETIVLEVKANGTPPLRYQWFRNGEPIDAANAPSLILRRSGCCRLRHLYLHC